MHGGDDMDASMREGLNITSVRGARCEVRGVRGVRGVEGTTIGHDLRQEHIYTYRGGNKGIF